MTVTCVFSQAFAEPGGIGGKILEFRLKPELEAFDVDIPSASASWKSIASGNFNSDSCSDLLVQDQDEAFTVLLSDCRSGFILSATKTDFASIRGFRPVVGRLDADSCSDVLFLGKSEAISMLSDCNGGFMPAVRQTSEVTFLDGAAAIGNVAQEQRILSIGNRKDGTVQIFRLPFAGIIAGDIHLPIDDKSRFLSFADLNGDGVDESVTMNVQGGSFVGHRTSADVSLQEQKFPWQAQFPDSFEWEEVFLGDFNGDGNIDLAARGSGIAGWWLAQSNGKTGLESPVVLPSAYFDRGAIKAVLDLDGDGISEVLGCRQEKEVRCRIAREKLLPISNVNVRSEGNVELSRGDGSFRLSAVRPGMQVVLEKDGWIFPRNAKVPFGPEVKNFLGVNQEIFLKEKGRAVHYIDVPPGPKVCTGYLPVSDNGKWGAQPLECPENYAWFAVDDGFADPKYPANAFERGHCCPLPYQDMLTSERVTLSGAFRCPDETVFVGVHRSIGSPARQPIDGIVCQKVNTARYHLGPLIPGMYFGYGASSRLSGKQIDRESLPAAVYWGASREAFDLFDRDGCIASTPGAMYVGNDGGSDCRSHLFRSILQRTDSGIEAAVQMFPRCDVPPNPRDPIAGCR